MYVCLFVLVPEPGKVIRIILYISFVLLADLIWYVMKKLKTFFTLGLILSATELFGQILPPSYQPMLNEIVLYFETIRGSNSITQGKTTLSVVNVNKITLRVEHKGEIKNLTFEKTPDEENQLNWVAANELTTDMVNKYEEYLTRTLESMHQLSERKSKE